MRVLRFSFNTWGKYFGNISGGGEFPIGRKIWWVRRNIVICAHTGWDFLIFNRFFSRIRSGWRLAKVRWSLRCAQQTLLLFVDVWRYPITQVVPEEVSEVMFLYQLLKIWGCEKQMDEAYINTTIKKDLSSKEIWCLPILVCQGKKHIWGESTWLTWRVESALGFHAMLWCFQTYNRPLVPKESRQGTTRIFCEVLQIPYSFRKFKPLSQRLV